MPRGHGVRLIGIVAALGLAVLWIARGAGATRAPTGDGARAAPYGSLPHGEPGNILWAFEADDAIVGSPAIFAIALDAPWEPRYATIYLATREGSIYAVDGEGTERWRYNHSESAGTMALAFEAAPAVGSDGTVYLGVDTTVPDYGQAYVLAVAADGTLRWAYEAGDVNGGIVASAAIDRQGPIVLGGRAGGPGWSGGQILALSPLGADLAGFPVRTGPIRASAVVLGDFQTVLVSDGGIEVSGPTPTANPTIVTPTAPPASATMGSDETATPKPTIAAASATPTSTPAVSQTVTSPAPSASPTEARPSPSPSATSPAAQAYLPRTLAPTGETDAVEAPSESQSTGSYPARLHILYESKALGPTYDLELAAASSLAASGEMVVFWMRPDPDPSASVGEGAAYLVAFDVEYPALQLWQMAVPGALAGSPVLGAWDRSTSSQMLYYYDPAGQVYALRVQTRRGAVPQLIWSAAVPATEIRAPALGQGAPALGERADGQGEVLYVPCGPAPGTGASRVVALAAATGARLWSTELPGEAISSAANLGPDGTLYVGTTGGRLYAIETESSGLSTDAQWPAFRHDAQNTGCASLLTSSVGPSRCPQVPLCTPGVEPTESPLIPTPVCPPCRQR